MAACRRVSGCVAYHTGQHGYESPYSPTLRYFQFEEGNIESVGRNHSTSFLGYAIITLYGTSHLSDFIPVEQLHVAEQQLSGTSARGQAKQQSKNNQSLGLNSTFESVGTFPHPHATTLDTDPDQFLYHAATPIEQILQTLPTCSMVVGKIVGNYENIIHTNSADLSMVTTGSQAFLVSPEFSVFRPLPSKCFVNSCYFCDLRYAGTTIRAKYCDYLSCIFHRLIRPIVLSQLHCRLPFTFGASIPSATESSVKRPRHPRLARPAPHTNGDTDGSMGGARNGNLRLGRDCLCLSLRGHRVLLAGGSSDYIHGFQNANGLGNKTERKENTLLHDPFPHLPQVQTPSAIPRTPFCCRNLQVHSSPWQHYDGGGVLCLYAFLPNVGQESGMRARKSSNLGCMMYGVGGWRPLNHRILAHTSALLEAPMLSISQGQAPRFGIHLNRGKGRLRHLPAQEGFYYWELGYSGKFSTVPDIWQTGHLANQLKLIAAT
ncbi:hypothetical protein ACRALDRAFT_210970 [Sodiomyces alcalophilus JCM 7366]|uniref:uncharacterized protein n=1 Tax=Sodiomyces alcalophilus JCM 7366 TaxID=591952 RepID=UPI0039B4E2F8